MDKWEIQKWIVYINFFSPFINKIKSDPLYPLYQKVANTNINDNNIKSYEKDITDFIKYIISHFKSYDDVLTIFNYISKNISSDFHFRREGTCGVCNAGLLYCIQYIPCNTDVSGTLANILRNYIQCANCRSFIDSEINIPSVFLAYGSTKIKEFTIHNTIKVCSTKYTCNSFIKSVVYSNDHIENMMYKYIKGSWKWLARNGQYEDAKLIVSTDAFIIPETKPSNLITHVKNVTIALIYESTHNKAYTTREILQYLNFCYNDEGILKKLDPFQQNYDKIPKDNKQTNKTGLNQAKKEVLKNYIDNSLL